MSAGSGALSVELSSFSTVNSKICLEGVPIFFVFAYRWDHGVV
jgi:hypothetical protein